MSATTTITPQQVQKLREITSAGILDCKKALESSGGDFDKAIQFLREKGKASAAQKAGRSASQGLVGSWISADAKKASLVEVNCETDFVARTQNFQEMVKKLTVHVAENATTSAETLASQKLKDTNDTVESYVKEQVGKLGENLKVKKVASFGGAKSLVGQYVHQPINAAADMGTLGVLVEVQTEKDAPEARELVRELAMQVAAANPKWVSKDDVPADVIEREKGIYLEQCKQSGKPEAAWPKISEGKLKDFFKQFCLVEQAYIRESSKQVQALVDAASEKSGSTIKVMKFVRFKVGEE